MTRANQHTDATDYVSNPWVYDDTSYVTLTNSYQTVAQVDNEWLRHQEALAASLAAIPRWCAWPPTPPVLCVLFIWIVTMGRQREWRGKNFKIMK